MSTTHIANKPKRSSNISSVPSCEAVLDSVGLKETNLTRLEVLWSLECQDEENDVESESNVDQKGSSRETDKTVTSTDIWWPSTLNRNGKRLDDGRYEFNLVYDARENFDQTETRIVFLNSMRLFDLSEKAVMRWRLEGTELKEKDHQDIVNLVDIVGKEDSNDDPLMELMQHLPMVQQQKIAVSYRAMVDKLMKKLDELKQEKDRAGVEQIVTADDMNNILADLKETNKV
mmetsp:Transcript_2592/g.3525  ORF Transcript_2592/g.3525 Transcript_2592/m.3525 type:complete len:231 (+) Transcript_2592:41-733(+)